MLVVKEVKSKKEQREFLNFPLQLYKDCPYFVPPLYGDEKKIFSKNYVYYETSEAVYYNAYLDGKIVGIDTFGASAPAKQLFTKFGFTAQAVVDAVKEVVGK